MVWQINNITNRLSINFHISEKTHNFNTFDWKATKIEKCSVNIFRKNLLCKYMRLETKYIKIHTKYIFQIDKNSYSLKS